MFYAKTINKYNKKLKTFKSVICEHLWLRKLGIVFFGERNNDFDWSAEVIILQKKENNISFSQRRAAELQKTESEG